MVREESGMRFVVERTDTAYEYFRVKRSRHADKFHQCLGFVSIYELLKGIEKKIACETKLYLPIFIENK